MLTLAELKRQAAKGNMSLEIIERFHKTGEAIPESFRGIRRVIKSISYGLILQNLDGTESRLEIRGAKLLEYTGSTLTVYAPGDRKPTDAEQKLLDEWYAIEKDYYEKNPTGNAYWKKKDFFKKSPYPYMSGFDDLCSSKRYLLDKGTVMDKQIRGEKVLVYRVHFDNKDHPMTLVERNIFEALKADYEEQKITAEEVAKALHESGHYNYIPDVAVALKRIGVI